MTMRRWGFASVLCALVAVPLTAAAQAVDADVGTASGEAASAAPVQAIGYGALPGGLHVNSAETLAKGVVQFANLDGVGYRTGLLGTGTRFIRATGDIAGAFGITDMISAGLSLDGRYDKHHNPTDDGYVGDPRLLIRAAKAVGANHFGAQLGLWLPGKSPPSVAASATSVDIRALVSIPAGPGLLSFEAGFRLDNSAKSAPDAMKLSLQDRVSLGVSDYNEAFGGAHLSIPAGKAWVGVEGSIEAFVGSVKTTGDAALAEGTILLRGGVLGGYHISDTLSAVAYIELTKCPGIPNAQVLDMNVPLIPYEASFTGGAGIQARFGGPKVAPRPDMAKDCEHHPEQCASVPVPILADIAGTVLDEADKPVVGAKVTLTLKKRSVSPVATDDKGAYVFKGVQIGETKDKVPAIDETGVEVDVAVDGKKPGKATIATVAEGGNTVPPIKLEPVLPPGQLRGVVRALPGGKAVAGATVTVAPGDKKAETGADGTFTLDLAPGQYKITVKAAGLADQELDVTIDPNGVAIKNIDLHK